MILRRPYAFLVKHFKIIHTILLLGSVFLIYKTNGLVNFFSAFIRDNDIVQGVKSLSSKYIPLSMLVVSILIIILNGIIIYLLRYKNKPIKTYLFMMLYHILFTLFLFWMRSFIADLPYTTPSIRFISIVRDMFRFSIIVDIVIIAVCFVRAIGFDVKKFDFKKDILDLGVEEVDNEEYEFELKIDKDKIKSQIKRRIRYSKYFYKENKIFFNAIGAVIGIVILVFFIKYFLGMQKVFKQNQYFETDYLKIKVVDSYKTKTNTFGNKINSEYFYLITKLEVTNKTSYEYTIGPDELRVGYSDYELTAPTTEENSKFTEFGENYFSQIIKPYETRVFNFIFEIPVRFYYEDFQLKYLYDLTYDKNSELHYEYKVVSLSPKTFSDTPETVTTQTLGNEMSFEGSILGNTKITIYDMSINDTFYYNILKCYNSTCNRTSRAITAKTAEKFDLTLMRLNYKIEFDKDVLGSKYDNDLFISKLGTIRFEVNGKEYNNRLELEDMTPYYTKDYTLIQVRDKLKLADKIYLDFNVRDKVYTYVIKDDTKQEEEKEGE